jgi:hypothetical protein
VRPWVQSPAPSERKREREREREEKILYYSKAIYRFNTMLIKISVKFFM